MLRKFTPHVFCILVLGIWSIAFAQEGVPLPLDQAIEKATQNYPAIRAALAQEQSASATAELARISYQPKVDFLWQQNFASHNNVFGLLMPQATLPNISGPAMGTGTFAPVFGSATGLLLTWEPFDFGLRQANLDAASTIAKQAQAQSALTRFEVSVTAADAFLACVAAQQSARVAQANVERLEIFSQAVHVLVTNQLRPGADASRTDTELAAARNQAVRAQELAALALATLAEAIGAAGTEIVLEAGRLLELPPTAEPSTTTDLNQHPLARVQQSLLDTVRTRQNILARSYYPKFTWQSALFARGSGVFVDGTSTFTRGYYPDTANWATGLMLSFSPTEIFSLRKKKQVEASHYAAEQARYDQTIQRVKADTARAKVMIEAARKRAAITPLQLQAAQEAELRIRARYQAELATITEVADAQRIRTQAEIDNELARLSVWRALLAQAKANGDLAPFIALLKK